MSLGLVKGICKDMFDFEVLCYLFYYQKCSLVSSKAKIERKKGNIKVSNFTYCVL